MTLDELMVQTRFPKSVYQVWESLAPEGLSAIEVEQKTGLSRASVRNALQLLVATRHARRSRRARTGRGPVTEYIFLKAA